MSDVDISQHDTNTLINLQKHTGTTLQILRNRLVKLTNRYQHISPIQDKNEV
jgi:hypothetical protein